MRTRVLLTGFGLILASLVPFLVGTATSSAQTRRKMLLAAVEEIVLERVNFEREQHGLSPLELEPDLTRVARIHSVDMLEQEFFSHTNPRGQGPAERVAQRHRTLVGTTAENIWMGIRGELIEVPELARDIMDSLMGSEGHRQNILAEGITHIGIGIYSSAGRAFMSTEITATQLFAKVQGYTLEPVPEVLRWGSSIGFRLTRPKDSRATARYFDLWSEERERVAFGPVPIDRTTVQAIPGKYRLRFYYGIGGNGTYSIFAGPYVTIE